MSKWIFQDIKDAQTNVLYQYPTGCSQEVLQEYIRKYNAVLREMVEPEIYVRYELWTCDIYVDVEYIVAVTRDIYGDKVSQADIMGWIEKHKEPHHVLEGRASIVYVESK